MFVLFHRVAVFETHVDSRYERVFYRVIFKISLLLLYDRPAVENIFDVSMCGEASDLKSRVMTSSL